MKDKSKPDCPRCGEPSQIEHGSVVLCDRCVEDRARRADNKALNGGPEL